MSSSALTLLFQAVLAVPVSLTHQASSGNLSTRMPDKSRRFRDVLMSALASVCRVSWMPSFMNLVFGVVGIRSKKKVLWVNARRVIASVANMEVGGKFANPRHVSKAMSKIHLAVNRNAPVASRRKAGSPNPAPGSLIDFTNGQQSFVRIGGCLEVAHWAERNFISPLFVVALTEPSRDYIASAAIK